MAIFALSYWLTVEIMLIISVYAINTDTFWQSTSYITPKAGESYGTIRLGRSLRMQFNLIYHSQNQYPSNPLADDPWKYNIFRIGYDNRNSHKCDGKGSRYPGVWIYYDHNSDTNQFHPYLHVAISNIHDCWAAHPHVIIQNNTTYTITIQFNQTWVDISILDTKTNVTNIIANHSRPDGTSTEFLNTLMNIWISQSGSTPANVALFDITINTWDHPSDPTVNPSNSPTINPSVSPNLQPTASPSSPSPTIQPTNNPTMIPTIMATKAPTMQRMRAWSANIHTTPPSIKPSTFSPTVKDLPPGRSPNTEIKPEQTEEVELHYNATTLIPTVSTLTTHDIVEDQGDSDVHTTNYLEIIGILAIMLIGLCCAAILIHVTKSQKRKKEEAEKRRKQENRVIYKWVDWDEGLSVTATSDISCERSPTINSCERLSN